MEEETELYYNDYMLLYSDGTMSVGDWVWPCWELDKREVKQLYNALHLYFNK